MSIALFLWNILILACLVGVACLIGFLIRPVRGMLNAEYSRELNQNPIMVWAKRIWAAWLIFVIYMMFYGIYLGYTYLPDTNPIRDVYMYVAHDIDPMERCR